MCYKKFGLKLKKPKIFKIFAKGLQLTQSFVLTCMQ